LSTKGEPNFTRNFFHPSTTYRVESLVKTGILSVGPALPPQGGVL